MRNRSFEKLLKARQQLLPNETRRHIQEVGNFQVFRKSLLERQNPMDRGFLDNTSICADDLYSADDMGDTGGKR